MSSEHASAANPGPLAAVCRAFGEPLSLERLQLDGPGVDDVEVAVDACAVCHSDITYLDGKWGGDLPAVYGHEAAGRITAVGESARTNYSVGDRVVVTLIRSCGTCPSCSARVPTRCSSTFDLDETPPLSDSDGEPVVHAMRTAGFAERVVVHQSQVVSIPDDLPADQAALLACGVITGYGAVTRASSAGEGSDVVVVGAGGVGINAIQGARAVGAREVIAIDIDDGKLDQSIVFGSTARINASTEDATKRVLEVTDGRGASHVFVAVGSGPAIEEAAGYLAAGGELIIVGMPATGVTTTFDPTTLASMGQKVIGTKMGNAVIAEDIPMLIESWRRGDLLLAELISATYPFDQIDEAIAEARRPESIRVVINMTAESPA